MRAFLLAALILYAVAKAIHPVAAVAMARAPTPVTLPEIAANPERLASLGKEHADIAVANLRLYVLQQYDRVVDRLFRESERRRESNLITAQNFFSDAQWLCLLPLLWPIATWRRHKGRRWALVWTSVVSCLLVFTGVALLSGVFAILTSISQGLAGQLDPSRAMVDALFEAFLEDTVPLLVEGEAPWVETVASVPADAGSEHVAFSERLYQNLSVLHDTTFEPAVRLYRSWRWLTAQIPLFVTLGTALLFLGSLWPFLRDLLTLPTRAASGESKAVRKALRLVAGTVGRELLSILVLVCGVIALGVGVTLAMRQLNRAAVDVLVPQVEEAVRWLGTTESPHHAGVMASLASVPALLLLSVLVMAGTSVLWMFHARRICRARFHHRVALRAHDGFWKRTSWALVQAHWIPVACLTAAAPVGMAVLARAGTAPGHLVACAAVLWGVAVLGFLFFRGPRAMRRLVQWRQTEVQPDPPTVDENAAEVVAGS